MKFALLLVTVIGIALGLMIPGASSVPAPAAASVAPQVDPPRETVLDRAANGHFYAVADVNGEPIRFVVDTGATIVALTQEDAKRAHVAFDPTQFQLIGRGASGEVMGQAVSIDTVALDGKRAAAVRGVVLADSDMSLLGQTYLAHIDTVQIKGNEMRLK